MRRVLKSTVSRFGYTVSGLADGVRLVVREGTDVRVEQLASRTWLVGIPDGAGDQLQVDALDGRTWVAQRRGKSERSLLQMGPRRLRTHLLVDREAARADMLAHQRSVGNYLSGEHVAWVLRALGINCVFDVGGNVGQYGKSLRAGGYRGRIVSFEPLAHLATQLRAAAAGDPDWHVHEYGLGEEETAGEMTVVAGRGSTSSLLPVSEFGKQWSPRLAGVGHEEVRIRTLEAIYDEAVAGIDSPRPYLKLDTQGYDLAAFRGAGKRIGDFLGMQSELAVVPLYEGMPRMPEQLAAYEGEGFEITGMFPVSRDRKSLRVIEFDVVMVRADARSGR